MNSKKYIISNLAKHPHYYNEVIQLIENEFHYSSEYKFEIDFAPLVSAFNFENCLIIIDTEKNQLAAHLGFNKRVLIKNNFELPVVFIGGIVTKKEYRGQNLFRNLIEHCFNLNSQAALFILWSDIQNMYEKFGFHLAGSIIETGKNVINGNINGFLKTNFKSLSNKEFEQIKKLHKKQIQENFFTVKRDNINWEIIREMTSIDLYIHKNSSNIISSYFCYGKGRDLLCTIHECSITSSLELEPLTKYKLWLPEQYQIEFQGCNISYLGFIKIGNYHSLNNFLNQVTNQALNINQINSDVSFSYKNETFLMSQSNFLQAVFGPNSAEEFKAYNLNLYIPGTDSI